MTSTTVVTSAKSARRELNSSQICGNLRGNSPCSLNVLRSALLQVIIFLSILPFVRVAHGDEAVRAQKLIRIFPHHHRTKPQPGSDSHLRTAAFRDCTLSTGLFERSRNLYVTTSVLFAVNGRSWRQHQDLAATPASATNQPPRAERHHPHEMV